MQFPDVKQLSQHEKWWAVGFLLVLSYFTYVHNFWNPPALFWDENYHIASAQKYMNGVFFMEPHPPLGKLLIAAGEGLLNLNPVDNQFIGTDYATNPPAGFSFFGYRLFPVLLAWLTTPIVYAIFWLITRKNLWATLLSFLYVFDNALIVHSRSAMLDSTMLFFSALTILGFLLFIEGKDNKKKAMRAAILFGASFGAALATKAFALLFVLLVPFMLFACRRQLPVFWRNAGISILAFLVVYCGVWQIHFSIATRIEPQLPDAGYYQASDRYKALLEAGKTSSPFAFPFMLTDSLAFVSHYQEGVPRLDLSKPDENGSPWFLWPFGSRSISYRWETPDGQAYRYLYLVANPVIWLAGLIGVILSFKLLLMQYLVPERPAVRNRFLMTAFFTLYACYMIVMSQIDRVMYLYHYFLPLFFSFILFGLVATEIQNIGSWKITEERRSTIFLVFAVLVFVAFEFIRPLTYYELMSDRAVGRRNVLRLWEVHCARCERESILVIPAKSNP